MGCRDENIGWGDIDHKDAFCTDKSGRQKQDPRARRLAKVWG